MPLKLTQLIYFLSFCCLPLLSQTQYTLNNLSLTPFGGIQNEQTFVFQNLQLYPIYANDLFLETYQHTEKYSSLKKALEQQQLIIEEKIMPKRQRPDNDLLTFSEVDAPESATNTSNYNSIFDDNLLHPEARDTYDFDLNNLFFINQSQDTIYLMAGEMIKGGKQDRILAQDMILPPNSGKVEIPVFCAEKDRWDYHVNAPKTFSHTEKMSPLPIRATIQMSTSNQSLVWNVIQMIIVKQALITPIEDQSTTYTDLTQQYIDFFTDQLNTEKQIVGILAVSGDRILGCDIFANPTLFRQQCAHLLHAYATEAILHGTVPILPLSGAYAYLHQCLANKQNLENNLQKNGHLFKIGNNKVLPNTY